jgi:hypothetical protein
MTKIQRYAPITGMLYTVDVGPYVSSDDYDAVIAKLKEFEEDAARYRWIRDRRNNGFNFNSSEDIGKFEVKQLVLEGEAHYYDEVYLDEAIDRARHGLPVKI